MTRILALTRYDRIGASSRVRVLQYIPELERRGLSVSVQPLFSNDYVTRLYKEGKRSPTEMMSAVAKRLGAVLRRGGEDIVWLQQEIFPFLPFIAERGLPAGRKVVIDFDDAYHLFYEQHRSSVVRGVFGGKVAKLMSFAGAVVVGNPTLAAYARAAGAKNVHVVHSAVDVSRFESASARRPDEFTIGWIGTPLTAAQSLPLILEPVQQFLADYQARCILVGVDAAQFPDLRAEKLPWSEATEADFFSQISVGLCPLDDTPWSRGKSGYKIIQYMAAGRPTLTSPVGIAAELVEPEITGFHCTTPGEWYEALKTVHADPNLSTALGRRARTLAQTRYDSSVAAEALYRVFESCA